MSKDIFVPLLEDVDAEQTYAIWDELNNNSSPPEITDVLDHLPKLEAEVFWLFFIKKRNQKQIAQIMTVPQSTISYRFRRAVQKASYLKLITSIDIQEVISRCHFLREKEKMILVDLFFTANQDLTGRNYKTRQSSVKWIFVKTKRKVMQLERENPQEWGNQFGLLLLLEGNLGIRIK